MSENEFFTYLENLSMDQLDNVQQQIMQKISQQQAVLLLQKNARQLAKTKSRPHQTGAMLPKIPSNNANIKEMANSLDIDISMLMREISKR